MITLSQYIGIHKKSPDWTPERTANAVILLGRVNAMLDYLSGVGVHLPINPATGSQISGQTFGGFRPQDCPQGAPGSSHKQGQGVDIYDPQDDIDRAINDALLERFDLYREHPDSTKTWCHLTTRAPRSGRRTFQP